MLIVKIICLLLSAAMLALFGIGHDLADSSNRSSEVFGEINET